MLWISESGSMAFRGVAVAGDHSTDWPPHLGTGEILIRGKINAECQIEVFNIVN